jgi:hypothetical protein
MNGLIGDTSEKITINPKIAKTIMGGNSHQALLFHKYSNNSLNIMFSFLK